MKPAVTQNIKLRVSYRVPFPPKCCVLDVAICHVVKQLNKLYTPCFTLSDHREMQIDPGLAALNNRLAMRLETI